MGKHMKTIEALAEDINTIARKYVEVTIATLKKYWNAMPFKTILDNQFWSDVIAEVESHEIFTLATRTATIVEVKVKTLAKKLMEIVVKFIKTKGAIIEQELNSLKLEALKQVTTLKTQGRRLYRRSVEQADVIVARATARYNAMVADVEAQYATLLSDVTAQYKNIIAQVMMKYKMLVETSQKIYETATIEQIVTYVAKQSTKMTAEFKVLQAKYIADVKAFIEEYRIIISKLNVKDQAKIVMKKVQDLADAYIKLMDPYYQDFQKFLKNYQAVVMAKYEQLTNKMMAQYEKPDSDDFDIHFGKDDDYYGDDESYTEMIDNYDYEEKEEDSVLKVLKDEEKVVKMDIEIKPKPPSAEDELLLDTAQILIMVGSAFISFGVVMLAFFLCRQRLESSRKEKAMPYTIPARSISASTSPIVKNYQRVPTTTQQLLASPAHIEMYREEKAASPLLP